MNKSNLKRKWFVSICKSLTIPHHWWKSGRNSKQEHRGRTGSRKPGWELLSCLLLIACSTCSFTAQDQLPRVSLPSIVGHPHINQENSLQTCLQPYWWRHSLIQGSLLPDDLNPYQVDLKNNQNKTHQII